MWQEVAKASRHLSRAVVALALVVSVGCGTRTPEQLLGKAERALAAGEFRAAEIELKNLLQRDGDNGEARARLGEALLAQGDAVGAEYQLRAGLELGADPRAIRLPLLRALVAQRKFADVLARVDTDPEPEDGAMQVE